MAFTQAELEAAARAGRGGNRSAMTDLLQREHDTGFSRSLPANYLLRDGKVEVKPDSWLAKYGWLLPLAPMAAGLILPAAGAAGGAAASTGAATAGGHAALNPALAGFMNAGKVAAATSAGGGGSAAMGFISSSGIGRELPGAAASVYGTKKQASAAKRASEIEAQAARDAAGSQERSADKLLEFQRGESDRSRAEAETTRRANYDQWRAREARIGSVAESLGLGGRQIPDYVPISGQPAGGPPASGAGLPAMPQGNWRDPAFIAQAMKEANRIAYGFDKHTDPNYWLKAVPNGDGDYIWRRMLGEGAGGADVARMGPYAGQAAAPASAGRAAPYRVPTVQDVFAPSRAPVPLTPSLRVDPYRPRSIADYL